jgi:hypothetical protein
MSSEHSPVRPGAYLSVSDPSLTINQFCLAEHISRSMLYLAWKEGWGPEFYLNGTHRRITHRARLEWQRQREAAARDQTPSNQKHNSSTEQMVGNSTAFSTKDRGANHGEKLASNRPR